MVMILMIPLIASRRAAPARVDTREYPVTPFQILERKGEVGFETEYYTEKQSRDGGDTIKLKHRYFEEYIQYQVRGYSYHPRFLDFRAIIKIGMTQQHFSREGSNEDDSDDSNEELYGYDIFLNFLKEHPFSFAVYANRDRRAVLQLFTDRQMIETENYGILMNWKRGPFPMDIAAGRHEFRQWGFDSESESRTDFFQWNIRNQIGERVNSELRYRYQDYEEDFELDGPTISSERHTELKSHDLSFNNTIYFDQKRRSFLNSYARYFDQTGTQDLTNYYWQERLQLQLTERLRSYVLGTYLRNEFEDSEVETYTAETGIDHRLFESLEEHFDVHWRRTEFDSIEETVYGATGRLNYRKRTGWGYLTSGYGLTVDQFERTGGGGNQRILDEAHTLSINFTTFLNQTNIQRDTIVVTDINNLTRYTEGFDYIVEERDGQTGLRILAGGLLSEGDSVLVDYEVDLETDLEYTSIDQNFYIRHDFERIIPNLAVYYRWRDLSTSGAPDEANVLEYTSHLAGFMYRWKDLTWTEEYEDYESNFSVYDQFKSQLEGNHNLWRSVRAGWNVGYLMIDYNNEVEDPNGDYSDIFYASANVNGRIHRYGFWELTARARDEQGRTEETLWGVLARVGVNWRKVRIEAGARVEEQERFDSKRDRMHLYFSIAREF